MVKITAKVDLYINKGSAYEKQTFTKGEEYDYLAESSTWQNQLVMPNEGTGQSSMFNEEDFMKYFSFN